MDDPPAHSQLIIGIVGAGLLGVLYSTANAALLRIAGPMAYALREEHDHLGNVADRYITEGRLIRGRLAIGRMLSFTAAVVLSVLAGRNHLESFAFPLAFAAVYGFLSQVGIAMMLRRPPMSALRFLRSTRVLETLASPVAAPLVWLADKVALLVPAASGSSELPARAIEHMIEQGEEEGAIEEQHADMLRSVLEFRDTVAREVMVPRIRMEAFEVSTPIDEVVRRVVDSAHSRYPVYRGGVDQIEGVLVAKELFHAVQKGEPFELVDLIRRPALFVSEAQKIDRVLQAMQQRRFHLAVVVDEFGGVAGVVTLEDILEELVGEIQDELDDDADMISEAVPGQLIVDANISVYDLAERVGDGLVDEDLGDFASLGGMMVHLAGRVPTVGEVIASEEFDLKVLDADERRILKVEVMRRPPPSTPPPAARKSDPAPSES